MQTRYDVIVVGAGVIGCSIAYHLSKRGKSVLLLEKGTVAGKASSAAAGMLGAQTELQEDRPLYRLGKASRAMFPDVAKDLKRLSGIDIEYEQNGIYKVATTEEQAIKLQSLVQTQQQLGEEAKWIESEQLQNREPSLISGLRGAMHLPDDGHVSAPQLTKAIAQAAVALGTEIREFTEVYRFIKEKESVKEVETNRGRYTAENVVVAGGAWSEQLLKEAGTELETYPVKGECFSVTTDKRLIQGTIFSEDCYIVPKSGARLLVGATEKAHSFDEAVTLGGISRLMESAKRVLPELENAKWEKAWAGIRPQTKDGIPYLGVHPHYENLYIATGHYRNGILLAPITGKVISDFIDGLPVDEDWVSAFQLNRSTIQVQ